MAEQFRDPAFLRKEVRPGPLKGEEYGEGGFTIVANLENLPETLRSQVPEGYVIKQYRDSRLDTKDQLFGFEPDSNEAEEVLRIYQELKRNGYPKPSTDLVLRNLPNRYPYTTWDGAQVKAIHDGWSLMGMAKKLQMRQRKANEYFGKELPDFVLPSQFIVGPDKDGVGHIYEVQKNINPEIIDLPEYMRLSVDKFENTKARGEAIGVLAEQIKSLCGEKLPDIKKDLEIFIRLAKQLPDKEGWFPDLAPGNLIFTKEGFCYIDTNYVIPLAGLENRGMHKEAEEAKIGIQNFIQSLEDLVARL